MWSPFHWTMIYHKISSNNYVLCSLFLILSIQIGCLHEYDCLYLHFWRNEQMFISQSSITLYLIFYCWHTCISSYENDFFLILIFAAKMLQFPWKTRRSSLRIKIHEKQDVFHYGWQFMKNKTFFMIKSHETQENTRKLIIWRNNHKSTLFWIR